jgi:hypothetical protein
MESQQETEITQYPPIRKQDGSWARSEEKKAETFTTHFSKVLKPNEITLEKENKLLSDNHFRYLRYPYKALYYQRSENRNKKPESKEGTGLRLYNQSNTAEAARNGNKIYYPIM